MEEYIRIKGAKENNLKNIDVKIPRNKMVVFTGVSGSGKSSLAFDTLFAEGQRRYMESLSSYARQFLGQMEKPNVELIDGLSPAISIDQKTTNRNPRSTVGTVTEVYDYLRLLYARIGKPFCPNCGKPIEKQSVDEICDKVMSAKEGTKILVCSPIVRGRKGEYSKQFEQLRKSGYVRVLVDGNQYSLEEDIKLDRNIKHSISVVIDRLVIKKGIEKRLTESIETSLKLADGLVVILDVDTNEEKLFSDKYACSYCGTNIEEIEPRLFSFNSPYGACPDCSGLGYKMVIDEKQIVKDDNLTLREGAIKLNGWNLDSGKMMQTYFEGLRKHYKFDLDTPFKKLPKSIQKMLLYGDDQHVLIKCKWESEHSKYTYDLEWEGIITNLYRRYKQTESEAVRRDIENLMKYLPCETCHGERLKKEALSVKINNLNISQLTALSVEKMYEFFDNLKLTKTEELIGHQLIKEIKARLKFLIDVGLKYLTLNRRAESLSGGESQRIRLATQIGSGLVGVLYILDEPSIGLHQRDNDKLLNSLKSMRDLGNTLVVIEHDEETIRQADYIIDIGPKAGIHGGEVVATGTLDDIIKNKNSLTGKYLSGELKIEVPKNRRQGNGFELKTIGAKQNNLKNIDVSIPLGTFTAITGVSGSGKSSLLNEIIYPALADELMGSSIEQGKYKEIKGIENLDKVILIDQSPIGRTPRSNPATYTGVFTPIRELFAMTPDAKERGFNAGRFSFNVKGGRCENCEGDGIIKIAMNFLPDVYVPCEVCGGKRYNRETLAVKYKGKTISDVLEMTCDEALEFFDSIPSIKNKLQTIVDVGLGYIRLGQSATTLSGGEAQRVKLATELAKRSTGKTIYLLDEPTTGLHPYDIQKLILILQRLVDAGNTVVVIEHNLDVIKNADYIIDLGPEGGDEGGNVVVCGTPEQIAKNQNSFTGIYLNKILK